MTIYYDENKQDYLLKAKEALNKKLRREGIVILNMKPFEDFLIDIGELYHKYKSEEEL